MKGKAVYKGAYNRALTMLAGLPAGGVLPSLSELAALLNVSRTTARAVRDGLCHSGLIRTDGATYQALRPVGGADRFPEPQTLSAGASVERQFMEWILHGDFQAGQLLNSAELARRFGTSTTTIREYLSHFQHFGLIERRPNSAWIYLGITKALAEELYDVREMFELRAARRLITAPDGSPGWAALDAITVEHHARLADLDARYRDFPALDEKLHRLVHERAGNR